MNKNKLLIGLGTISAAAMPALAVISCGSDDAKDSSKTSFVGSDFVSSANEQKIADFLIAVGESGTAYDVTTHSVNNEGVYKTKEGLTVVDYEVAYKAAFANDADMQAKFVEILKVNKNDPKVASHIIYFTLKTIMGMSMAMMGLSDSDLTGMATTLDLSDASAISALTADQQAIVNKMKSEISGGTLDAKTIADGIMTKFTNINKDATGPTEYVSADTIWGSPIWLNYINVNGVLTEGMLPSMVSTMGGTETVKTIVKAAGYGYSPE